MSKQLYYDSLTPMQKLFVDNFIQNRGNQSKAYELAGYSAKTPAAVRSGASRLMSKKSIREAVKERTRPDELKRLAINKMIINNIEDISLGNPRNEIVEGDSYMMTPSLGDQINAAKLYDKIISLSEYEDKSKEIDIKIKEAQLKVVEAKLGTDEEDEEMKIKDIEEILNSISSDSHGA